jgi:hypothetical protein
MSELLTAPEWNGMLLIASEGNATTHHRRGRKSDSKQGIGMKCRNSSLRPDEMSELLTAREWNGMLLIASEGICTTLTPRGGRRDGPQSIGVRCRNPALRPNEMSELPTAPE